MKLFLILAGIVIGWKLLRLAVRGLPVQLRFEHMTYDSYDEIEPEKWYRISHWKSDRFLVIQSKGWDKTWKCYQDEVEVAGVSHENRARNFMSIGDAPDFEIDLLREPNNRYDKNAIRVIGTGTKGQKYLSKDLGYIPRETAARLKSEQELDARPVNVNLPGGDYPYSLKIKVLVRSQTYKRKMGLIPPKPKAVK